MPPFEGDYPANPEFIQYGGRLYAKSREPTMYRSTIILAALVVCAAPLRADEGMWTYDNFPVDKVERAYGFKPDQRWLDHLRLSSVRLARGCSGAFVSPQGLVQTNHHCAAGCIAQLST